MRKDTLVKLRIKILIFMSLLTQISLASSNAMAGPIPLDIDTVNPSLSFCKSEIF